MIILTANKLRFYLDSMQTWIGIMRLGFSFKSGSSSDLGQYIFLTTTLAHAVLEIICFHHRYCSLADMTPNSKSLHAAFGSSSVWSRTNTQTYCTRITLSGSPPTTVPENIGNKSFLKYHKNMTFKNVG